MINRRRVFEYVGATNKAFVAKSYFTSRRPTKGTSHWLRVCADGTYILRDTEWKVIECGQLERTSKRGVYRMISNKFGSNRFVH
jgi:hypothetical protein